MIGVLVGLVVGAAGFWAARTVWKASTGVSLLSAVVVLLMSAIFVNELSGATLLVLLAGAVGAAGGYLLAPRSGREAVIFGSAVVLAVVIVAILLGLSEQPWTSFLTVGLTGVGFGWLAKKYPGDGGASAALIGGSFLLGLAVAFQGDSRDKLVETLASAAFAILVSGVIFVGANKWFEQARSRWTAFGTVTGAVLLAAITWTLHANRLLEWRPTGEGESLSWLLWLLMALVGGAVGFAIASTTGRTRQIAAVAGTTISAGVLVLFLSPSAYPAMKFLPLLVWPVALALAGLALVRFHPTWTRLLVAGTSAALLASLAGGEEVDTVGVLGIGLLGVLLSALMGADPRKAAITGALFGWLIAAWGIPALGTGTAGEAALGLLVLGALTGLRIAFNQPATAVRRDKLTLQSRAVIFLVPALAFISGTLVIPTIRTLYLSFLDARGSAGVGLDNYVTIFTDDGIVNLSGWADIFSNRFFWFAVVFMAGGAIYGIYSGARRGQAFEANGASLGGLVFGAFLLSFAVFAALRGTIFNNLWWVIAVTFIASSAGLAIAVLADRAKFESLAKSIIFMPMAVSFVGAGIIWRFMYVARDATKEQTGIMNAIWTGLGRLSFSNFKWVLILPLVAVIVGLLYLAYRGYQAKTNTLAAGSLFAAAPLTWFVWRLAGPGIGGFAVDEAGEVVRTAEGAIRAEPIQFIPDGPYNNFWLMVVLIWIQTGFTMVIFSAAIKAVPADLIEASHVDGATEAQTFWRVTIPQIFPTIGVVTTTLIVLVMKVFDIVKVMTNGNFDTQVLANEMFQRAIVEFNLGLGSALAVVLFVSVVPVMVINIRRMTAENA